MASIMYYDVIQKPLVTEKSMDGMGMKKYTFLVHPEANKTQIKEAVEKSEHDLLIVVGIAHSYPDLPKDTVIITDQPRQLANYLKSGYENSVGEISSHSMVMGTRNIVPLETADTIREMLRDCQ